MNDMIRIYYKGIGYIMDCAITPAVLTRLYFCFLFYKEALKLSTVPPKTPGGQRSIIV